MNDAGSKKHSNQHLKKPTDPEQSRRFIETARELGCDEDEAAFRDKLRVIARQKPKDEPNTPKKR